jgi:hypothetical protein
VLNYTHNFSVLPPGSDNLSSCAVTVSVLYPSRKAKADVTFTFTTEVVANWPFSLRDVRASVDVRYGQVEYVLQLAGMIIDSLLTHRSATVLRAIEESLRTVDIYSHWHCLERTVDAVKSLYP